MLVGFVALGACDRRPKQESLRLEVHEEREAEEPPEPGLQGISHCRRVPRPSISWGSEAEPIEVGRAVPFGDGFALSALRGSGETHALLRFEGASGGVRSVELARVLGTYSAPELFARGDRLFFVVASSDAGSRTLQLGTVRPQEEPRWGPVIGEGRDESEVHSLATLGEEVLVVWDADESRTARSQVFLQRFRSTLEAAGPKVALSSSGRDASDARIFAHTSGYSTVWLFWGQRPEASADAGLVVAAPSGVQVQRLDRRGEKVGTPVDVGVAAPETLYEAASRGDDLWIVVLDGRTGTPHLFVSDASGALSTVDFSGPELGPEPVRLVATTDHVLLAGRTKDGTTLLGVLDRGRPVELLPEPLLFGAEVLGSSQEGLVVARPKEHGVEIEVISCETGKAPSH